MTDFKPGDIVQLKSDGPSMTVESISLPGHSTDSTVNCVWFTSVSSQTEELKRASFKPETLKKAQ